MNIQYFNATYIFLIPKSYLFHNKSHIMNLKNTENISVKRTFKMALKFRQKNFYVNVYYRHIRCFSAPITQGHQPGVTRTTQLDERTGKPTKNYSDEQKFEWLKKNESFRWHLVNKQRNIANELLFGRAAVHMINKIQYGGNQPQLKGILVNNLYSLKLSRFRFERMERGYNYDLTTNEAYSTALGKKVTKKVMDDGPSFNRKQKGKPNPNSKPDPSQTQKKKKK